jgi:hypothetical protein
MHDETKGEFKEQSFIKEFLLFLAKTGQEAVMIVGIIAVLYLAYVAFDILYTVVKSI